MRKLSWLQLTDLHCGMKDQDHLWPNIRKAFFDDLEEMYTKTGPWSFVFFTGDLVQQGSREEFKRLNDLLEQIWKKFRQLGSSPLLVPVPGNHDLRRPDGKVPAVKLLINSDPDAREEIWNQSPNPYRGIVAEAFDNYSEWSKNCPLIQRDKFQTGALPGDFSTSSETNQIKLGVVGLNTAFLQLAPGDFQKRLAWDQRQLHAACDGDAAEWLAKHDFCILMTHHGPDWLDTRSMEEQLPEISPAGRFLVHLFGHNHVPDMLNQSAGGGPQKRLWLGKALFGREKFGETQEYERNHGYGIGTLEFDKDGNGSLRLWPRTARLHPVNGWELIPDYFGYSLKRDGGTEPEAIGNRRHLGDPEEAEPEPGTIKITDRGTAFADCLEEIRGEFRAGGIYWAFMQENTKSEVTGNVMLQIALEKLLYAATRLCEEAVSANVWVCHLLDTEGKPGFLRSQTREGYFEIRQLVDRPNKDITYRSNEIFYGPASPGQMSVAANAVAQKKTIFEKLERKVATFDSRKELDRGITHILGVPSRDYDQAPLVVEGEPLSLSVDFKFLDPDALSQGEREKITKAGDEIREVFAQVLNLWRAREK